MSLLRLCLYIRFVRRDTWPFPYIVRKIVISVSVLGKRKAICRPLILIVRAHSSNAMTATQDHEQTRSCRSESDPFTFLRTSCPVDHFESFLSVRSCSTYLCTGQKTVLVFHFFDARFVSKRIVQVVPFVYTCQSKVDLRAFLELFRPLLTTKCAFDTSLCENYAVYRLYAVHICVSLSITIDRKKTSATKKRKPDD